jgi:serine/threonine-protein kinase
MVGEAGVVLDGAYQLVRAVSQGGMSTVFEAIQLKLQRRVAVKVMSAELAADPEALARFRREVKIASKLTHPHIVQLLDFGFTPSGQAYLVTEYLEGEDLEERLFRVGRLPLPATAALVKQLASGLAAMHAKGVVHRDLKPGNVVLVALEGGAEFVKIVDFGISKLRPATQLTKPATVLGTPEYMSPEQATGRTADVDHRTDQWALGATIWRTLSGQPPFSGGSVEDLLSRIVHEEPPPLLDSAPHLTIEVDRVLRRALSRRPSDRFATVAAFARAFQAAATAWARREVGE